MERIDLSEREWLNKAQAYCAKAEHCASQVRHKLAEWGADSSQTERIITRLEADGFISAERFCRAFAHDTLLYQGWGRYKITMMLRQLNLPETEIQNALQDLDPEDYQRVLRKVAAQKKSASKDQLTRFLLQRGFTYEEIKRLDL